MQKAILGNPEVLAKWHAYLAANSEVDVARGYLMPKLDVSVGVGRERLSQPGLADLDYTRNGHVVTLNQMLFDGFASVSEVRRLGKAKLTRYYEFLDAAEITALEAGRAYFDVMRYRFLLKLAEQNYVEHRAVYEQLLQRTQSGAGRRVDVEHAESRLALAEVNLSTEQANLHDVTARYMRLVNEAPPEVMFGPALMAKTYPATIDDALRAAFRHNPTLLAAAENAEAAQYRVESQRGAFLPRLDFRARSEHTGNYQGVPGTRAQQVAEVMLSYNLFNGGTDSARGRQYAEERNLARDLRDKTCRDIRQTLVIAYNDVKRLRSQLGFLGIQVSTTEKSRDAYRAQFNIGQRSLLDLLDTENELFNARRAELNAEMDLAIALLRTQAGVGRLLATFELKHAESDAPAVEDGNAMLGGVCGALAPTPIETDNNAMTARALKHLESMKPRPAPAAPSPAFPDTAPAAAPSVAPASDASPAAAAPPAVAVPPAPTSSSVTAVAPQPAAASPATSDVNPAADLRTRLEAWAAAWSARDAAAYLEFYAATFKPGKGLSRAAWASQREARLTRPSFIQVAVSEVQTRMDDASAVTVFRQVYESDGYGDISEKTIEWIKEGGRWLIQRETSRPAPAVAAGKQDEGSR